MIRARCAAPQTCAETKTTALWAGSSATHFATGLSRPFLGALWGRLLAVVAFSSMLIVAGCSSPPPNPSATTTTATASDSPAAEEIPTAELSAALDALVEAGAPAAVVQVRNGEDEWSGAAGEMTAEGGGAAVADSTFRIASITKSMVATVILQIVDEGALTLDDDVEETLPGILPPSITIRQLLNHTSGLPDYVDAFVPSTVQGIADGASNTYTDDQLIAAALEQPTPHEPGAAFTYSNTNYVVLGKIIEKLDGKSIADSLLERIFNPLSMSSTTYPVGAVMPPGSLSGYLSDEEGLIDVTKYEPSIWSSGGAIISTVGDVNRFFRALFDGTLLPAELVNEMQETSDSGYGLGVLSGGDACDPAAETLVFGQRGNGFGYSSLSLSSADGQRQVTLAWNATAADPAKDPLTEISSAAIVAGLAATCPA